MVRLGSSLHGRLAREAQKRGLSLNRLCECFLEKGLEKQTATEEPPWKKESLRILRRIQQQFAGNLIGLVAFGSQIRGEATSASDLDLLVVVSKEIEIERSLYQGWENNAPSRLPFEVNPHFVRLPSSASDAGGIWFEIALESEILWQQDQRVTDFLSQIQEAIQSNKVCRFWSNGHPYWVRNAA